MLFPVASARNGLREKQKNKAKRWPIETLRLLSSKITIGDPRKSGQIHQIHLTSSIFKSFYHGNVSTCTVFPKTWEGFTWFSPWFSPIFLPHILVPPCSTGAQICSARTQALKKAKKTNKQKKLKKKKRKQNKTKPKKKSKNLKKKNPKKNRPPYIYIY